MKNFKILIAIDNSPYSLNAAKYGLQLGRKLDARIGILLVIDKLKEMGNIDAGILPDEARILLHKEAEQQMENIITENPDLSFEKIILDGSPDKDIVKTAEAWDANLVVVGSHGKTGIVSRLMGSVTEGVIRNSTVPVIIISHKMNANI